MFRPDLIYQSFRSCDTACIYEPGAVVAVVALSVAVDVLTLLFGFYHRLIVGALVIEILAQYELSVFVAPRSFHGIVGIVALSVEVAVVNKRAVVDIAPVVEVYILCFVALAVFVRIPAGEICGRIWIETVTRTAS